MRILLFNRHKIRFYKIIQKQLLLIIIVLNTIHFSSYAQNRINTYNNIGWYNYVGTFKVSNKFGIHTEYQWRRNHFITDKQQSILRLGLNYHFSSSVLFRIGYGWIETYPYGEIPLNSLGRNTTEHRIFEMIQLRHKEGIVDFFHRYILEQRFVGRYSSANSTTQDEFPLQNRIRYMIRLQVPLRANELEDKVPYLAFYDEVFIGFGKNVNANVFDQNRIALLLGYRFNKSFILEGGYLNQILQYGRQINSQNIFQYNNGVILNANFNFDLTKKDQF
jgi:hypothetical protein